MKKRMCDFFASIVVGGILYSGCLAPAQAQTCPTRPFGDSSNACASTAFVQAAVGAAGFVVGPSSSTDSDIALFNGTTGKLLKDGGISLDLSVANAFPGPGDPSIGNVTRGHIVAPLDANVVFGGNGVFPLQVVGSNPYAIGTAGTVASSTVGQIFSVRFTSAFLSGSPITISYTAVGGDTVSTIGLALCGAVNANATLHNALTSLPLFCQSINQTTPGLFNLQWDVSYTDMAIASVGTGTINFGGINRTLDFAVTTIGRRIPGYVGQSGDNIQCLQFQGQSVSGAMDAVVGNMCGTLSNATGGSILGTVSFSASSNSAGHAQFAISSGMLLYDSTGAYPTGGFIGIGKLNIPGAGGGLIAFDGLTALQKSGGGGSASGVISAGATAGISWNATGGAADTKWWDAITTGAALSFRIGKDDQSTATTWLSCIRSTMTITGCAFPQSLLTIGTDASVRGSILLSGTSGTHLTLQAPAAASGTLTLPAGTTDFTATGGTSQVVKQTSSGGPFTVARLACTDLSDSSSGCSGSSSIIVGTTVVSSGTNTRILYDNAGTVGEYTLTGSGTVVVMQTAPTFITSITAPLVAGGSAAGSTLILESTSGAGTTDFIDLKTGSQVVAERILTTGHVMVGSTNAGLVTDDAARFNVVGLSSENTFSLTTYGGQSGFVARSSNGTSASPTQSTTNQTLFEFGVRGFTNSNAFSAASIAAIRFTAAENYTSTAQGSFFQFFTTPSGSTTPGSAAILWGSSGVSLAGDSTDPGASNVRIAGTARILSSTASSSPTTGSLIVSGGAGISGDVWASGNHSVSVAAKTLLLKQGANGAVGTFVCNGVTPVTVNNTNVAITDAIIISLNTVGGTVGAAPDLKTITGATGFTVACTAADTSTYNYALIKNAA